MRFKCLVVVALLIFPVLSQAKVFKIATEYPDGNAVLNELRDAGKRIEEATEGRLQFKFYPGGVMGDAIAVRRKIRIGQLSGAYIHSTALSYDFKNAQVLNAPLLFRNFDEVDAVRAEFDQELNQGFIDNGWHTFGLIEGGFAYPMTSVQVSSMEELKQQKLWLPANDSLSEQVAKAFEMNPITLNIGDVLTALQTGAINAIVAPPVGAIVLQWYSRTGFLTDAPFMYIYGVIALSERSLKGVADQDYEVLSRELKRSSERLDELARADNVKAFNALSDLGVEIVPLTDAMRADVEQDALEAVEKLIASGEFDADIYSRIVETLNGYRSNPVQ
ncbi:TRAP transporter substrate-binding protein DctP [Reinekea marinisedimentorum]|uniref:TRAP-type C4-dicarboxylate transport system substrate-binding protein n=1 Tax=Reinekea marinisedimentorum TaxID=230495 RepID=A0A4R3I533_9GAMM|nr:TRAP transporter substrate-binding protein DctP [Reinekea marinisedimentorum]TCS40751.1 TRAP-type C4-dicarboxylate transport system substrate-binding protein [Reinekea marinisedimentorum]